MIDEREGVIDALFAVARSVDRLATAIENVRDASPKRCELAQLSAPVRASNTEEVTALLSEKWQTTGEIAERWGRLRSHASKILNRLHSDGIAECRGTDGGGRGREKSWRLVARQT